MFDNIDIYRPPLGDLTVALLAGAATIVLVWYYVWHQRDVGWFRRVLMLSLRLLAVAVLAWILAGPSAEWGRDASRSKVPVHFLADISQSMQQEDADNPNPTEGQSADEPISRWQAVQRTWLDRQFLDQLDTKAGIHLHTFADQLRSISIDELQDAEADGADTQLFRSIESFLQMTSASSGLDAGQTPTGQRIVVVLSDGHDTARSNDTLLAERLRREGWTALGVPVGTKVQIRDVQIDAFAEADSLYENQSTWINATVRQNGFDHRQVRVTLLHEGRQIEEKIVSFKNEATQPLRFRVTPPNAESGGERIQGYQLVAEVLPLGGGEVESGTSEETFLENNSRWVFIDVSAERLRVALFEAQPYWDTKFLARILRDDPQIELTSVFAMAQGRVVTIQSNISSGSIAAEATEKDYDPLWLTPETLNAFDVVILGKDMEKFFGGNRAQWLVDFVENHDKALIFSRGKAFDTTDPAGKIAQQIISRIEPVEWESGTVSNLELTLESAARTDRDLQLERTGLNDTALADLPDMLAATRTGKEHALSVVMLRQQPRSGSANAGQAPGMAAVAHRRAGQGRVLAVLTDGLWQWAFLPSELKEHDTVYQGFWARTIRWLALGGQFLPGQDMSLALSRLKANPGQAVDITVITRYVEGDEFSPKLTVKAPDGSDIEVPLTRQAANSTQYRGSYRPEQPGVHEVVLKSMPPEETGDDQLSKPVEIRGRVAVYEESAEKMDPSARPDVLYSLCEAAGGECLNIDQRNVLLDRIEAIWQTRQSDRKMNYVFDQPWIFAFILAGFGLEWILRRRGGLM